MAKAEIPSDLIPRIADGDEKAFEELYRLTYRPLFSFLLSLTADQEIARDVMQETYLNVFMSAHSYTDKGNPLAWIMKIGKNLFLMSKRNRDSNIVLLEDASERISEVSFIEIEDIEARELLQLLFKTLSSEERSIVVLHVLSGFKYHEIAEIMGLPMGTILSKYHRAVRKMRKKAEKEGWQEI